MPNLPNPFADCNSADVVMPFADTAAAFDAPQAPDAAANQSSSHTGGFQEAPAADAADPHETAGAFDGPDISLSELGRRGFDQRAFMEAIEPGPMFLDNPSAEYRVAEIEPALRILAAY